VDSDTEPEWGQGAACHIGGTALREVREYQPAVGELSCAE
jgi:hypothetical protein